FNEHIKPSPYQQPFFGSEEDDINLFEYLKKKDILLHHPYNSIEPLLHMLEEAADDPDVLAIKMTIYRLAKNSRVTNALQKAAENGKHVSVLFELKARFDEENNIKEAERLEEAGCFVIHGISRYKTHTKLLLIVRKEENGVVRYVHMSSGNYNEGTARLYTDVALLTTNENYAEDVSEFFNVITGHSKPLYYRSLITSPRDMRNQLIKLIRQEAENAQKGLPSGIVVKINSLEDRAFIAALYEASEAGVPIKLIVRGICCLRPQRLGLSENIEVRSIVGEFLEHSRIYYFQNEKDPLIYAGSADVMVRSFDRRIESLFQVSDPILKKLTINILHYQLMDNINTYLMQEDGSYRKIEPLEDEKHFNIHREFFKFYATREMPRRDDLFSVLVPPPSQNNGQNLSVAPPVASQN
ncbi:MAG: polyphosphate kinase 1, partial [Bacteroidota bacterium]